MLIWDVMTMSQGPGSGARILVVDDDPGIRSVVCNYLTEHGYDVETVGDGKGLERRLAHGKVDLVVLDVMLPGDDGLTICRRLADDDGPAIIMLSALGGDSDRIVGLELGADDYLPKPCNPRELLARVRAVLRRRRGDNRRGAVCEFAGWRLDLVRRELHSPEGVLVNLSRGEFLLLQALIERPRRILTRDELLDCARGPESESYDRAIDVQVSRLRRKLDDGGGRREVIRTVRNEGYIFDPVVTWR